MRILVREDGVVPGNKIESLIANDRSSPRVPGTRRHWMRWRANPQQVDHSPEIVESFSRVRESHLDFRSRGGLRCRELSAQSLSQRYWTFFAYRFRPPARDLSSVQFSRLTRSRKTRKPLFECRLRVVRPCLGTAHRVAPRTACPTGPVPLRLHTRGARPV